jgi:toxin ParE1/3/4
VVDSIKEFPNSGRVVPEYNNKALREKILNNYRIVYRVKDEYIEIVVITHCSKLLDGLNG